MQTGISSVFRRSGNAAAVAASRVSFFSRLGLQSHLFVFFTAVFINGIIREAR